MKRTVFVWLTALLLVSLTLNSANAFRGAIVAADGRVVTCHDLETGVRTILPTDIGVKVAAIDRTFSILVWHRSDGSFYSLSLRDGKIAKLPEPNLDLWGGGKIVLPEFQQVRNLAISADDSLIAFESPRTGGRYLPYAPPAGSQDEKFFMATKCYNVVSPRIGVDKPIDPRTIPWYKYAEQAYTSTNVIAVSQKGVGPKFIGHREYVPASHMLVKYDSLYEGPPAIPWVRSTGIRSVGRGFETEEMMRAGMRSACFPTWSLPNKAKSLAFIMRCENTGVWGPIVALPYEIFKVNGPVLSFDISKPCDFSKGTVTQVSLGICEGLAWKWDGTLTYLSEGNLYSLDGKLIAKDLNATKVIWVDSSRFIFRTVSGLLELWDNGKIELLLNSVPAEFSYAPISPALFLPKWVGKTEVTKARK